MTAVLQEAWLWLLLAFVLGLVIGYFLRRYTIGDDPAEADEATAAAPAAQEPEPEPEPSGSEAAAESEQEPAPTQERRAERKEASDSGAFETATVTLAELSASAPSPAEPGSGDGDGEDASAPSADSPEEELREGPHFDENVHAEHVDAGDVYMPVLEPLRVPHGRREAASLSAASAASAQEPAPQVDASAPATEPEGDAIASVIDEEGAEAAVRDAEKGKPKRRSRRSS